MPKKNQPGCPCCGSNSNDCYSLICGNCSLPKADLTLTWANEILGGGSVTLAYGGQSTWQSACSNGLMYQLLCSSSGPELRVIYFTSGSCPDGAQQYCSNLRQPPFGLTLASYSCDPLQIVYNSQSAGCPTITNSGYTQFIVTGPQPQKTPPKTYCCITVGTAECNIVAPGTITVTVRQNNASGQVICSGTADSHGNFNCAIPAAGLYYFSASTTATGYSNQPVTAKIGRNGKFCDPSFILTAVVPTTLTASGFWGSVTLRPGLLDPYYFTNPGNTCASGSGPATYIGTLSSYTAPATCGCPTATFPIDFVFVTCGAAFPVPTLDLCFPGNIPDATYCPGNGPNAQQTFASGAILLSGMNTYPFNLTGTWQTTGGAISGDLIGCGNCTGTLCPTPVAVTQ